MKKSIFLAAGLFFSISTQAQILDIIKSTVKDKTGVDLNTPVKNTGTTTSTNTATTTPIKTNTSSYRSKLREKSRY